MRVDDDAKVFIYWDATLTFDPANTTAIVLAIDGTSYPMTWQGSATTGTDTNGRPQWKQTARTTYKFAGSSATISGTDVRLTTGRREGEPLVTISDGQIIPCFPTVPIDVT